KVDSCQLRPRPLGGGFFTLERLCLDRLRPAARGLPAHREVQFKVDVIGADGTARPLSEVSPVTRTLATEQFDDHVKRVRLYCHPRLRETLRPMNWEALLSEAAESV
ncbi:MAG: hypothetical protein AAF907_16730, partial [Planctomycetota bacterium]